MNGEARHVEKYGKPNNPKVGRNRAVLKSSRRAEWTERCDRLDKRREDVFASATELTGRRELISPADQLTAQREQVLVFPAR